MPQLPAQSASVPAGTSPKVAAALRSTAAMQRWERTRRLERLTRYFECRQYEDRRYDWDGRMIGLPGFGGIPMPTNTVPPVSERRPPAVYALPKVIVQRFTAMLFGEEGFPELFVEDDPDSEDFVRAIAEAASAPDIWDEARDDGGQRGTAVVSWAWVDGEPRLEVHDARDCHVLEWADRQRCVPAIVVKLWEECEPGISPDGLLVDRDGWRAREWSVGLNGARGQDRLYRYVPESGREPARWELVGDVVEFDGPCPVAWVQNQRRKDRHDGLGDYEGQEGMLDALNLTMCATVGGTAINADPTLVLHMEKRGDGSVAKGGRNVIWSEKGAEYLEISGSATEAGLKTTDKVKAFTLEAADVTLLDPEKMAGAAQSGEALRRLLFPMVKRAQKYRTQYGAGIVRALEGLLVQAQAMLKRDQRTVFKLPPKVEKEVEDDNGVAREKITAKTPRKPGLGTRVTLKWPPFFPPSSADLLAEVNAIQAANGQRPVISMRTAVEKAAPIFGVKDIDQELADILEHEEQMAEASAGALGKTPGSLPDAAGEEDDPEQEAAGEQQGAA